MFATIRKHQTWLLWVISGLTIASFVYYFRPDAKNSGGGGFRQTLDSSIDGETVTREAYLNAMKEAQLFYFFSHSEWPDSKDAERFGFNLDREIYQRLFLVKRAKAMGIHASDTVIGRMAGEILQSMGRENQSVTLEMLENQVLKPRGLSAADFKRLLESNALIQQLVATVGHTGKLTTPQEAELLLRRESEEISAEIVFFTASNQLAHVTVAPDALAKFYTNEMAAYRLPDRRQVVYVQFKAADYFTNADRQLTAITNLDKQIDTVYLQRGGTNYYKDKTPAAAKAEIRENERLALAIRAARSNAVIFADQLLNQPAVNAEALEKLATQKGLTAAVSQPFSANAAPEDLKVNAGFSRTAFALTAEDPIATVVGDDAVYVIALKQAIPSQIPSFDSIRTKVTADYQMQQALQLARAAGSNFTSLIVANVGKNFSDVCAQAKVTPVKLPAFSLSSRTMPEVESHITLGRLQELAYGLSTGATSTFVPTSEGGLVLHIAARTPPSNSKLHDDLPRFLAQLRASRQNEAFQSWFNHEAPTALRDTPLMRQPAGK